MTRRRIGVFTSSRADLGPLGPVIRALDEHLEVALVVIATGTHLAQEFGGRLTDIRLSDESRLETLDVGIENTTARDLGQVYGRVGSGVSKVLESSELDILVLLGDRWELLAAAGTALIHGVPIAHLHGGETTEGAIDDRIRHGITKLADLHLCATTESARRIRHMGEEAWRIIVTGAPGLDRISEVETLTDNQIEDVLDRELVRPFGLVVYHPPTVDRSRLREDAKAVYEASASQLGTAIALYPGADPGSQVLVEELHNAERKHANFIAERNLGDRYLPFLKAADVLVGNSSSGIIEATSLHLPVIDIGDRQRGRLRPENVIHIDDPTDLSEALVQGLSPSFRQRITDLTNPYGDGTASERIVRVLLDAPLDRLAHKPWASIARSGQVPIEELTITRDASIRDAMVVIDRGANQIAIVVDHDRTLVGTLTDGDLRRAMLEGASIDDPASDHATKVPVVATPSDDPMEVLRAMQRNVISRVPIVDDEGRFVGLHVMHSILGNVLQEDDSDIGRQASSFTAHG